MRGDRELKERKQELYGAAAAVSKAPCDKHGMAKVRKRGLMELLLVGATALEEIEKMRRALGPYKLDRVEQVIQGWGDE